MSESAASISAGAPKMVPAGYMFKTVSLNPSWLKAESGVTQIHSVSGCVSNDFCDYISHWKHNGFWLFDDVAIMRGIAEEEAIDLSPMTCFYYEAYGLQFDGEKKSWGAFSTDSFPTNVVKPEAAAFQGFDVVSFNMGNNAECSPLSCNSMCEEIAVNPRCLFDTFEQARSALDPGQFENAEPGPYRIFAVFTVEAPQ